MADLPHIIIDGYNYILRTVRIDSSQEHALWDARERLVRQVIAYRGQRRLVVTIVFDGVDLKGIAQLPRPKGVSVVFSQKPQNADTKIEEMVRSAKQPRSITVVTSDRSLAAKVAGYGSEAMTVEAFAQKLNSSDREDEYRQKYRTQMSKSELDEWLKLFDETEQSPD